MLRASVSTSTTTATTATKPNTEGHILPGPININILFIHLCIVTIGDEFNERKALCDYRQLILCLRNSKKSVAQRIQ